MSDKAPIAVLARDQVRFLPAEGDTEDDLLDKAYNCGKELHPKSDKAVWIDRWPVSVLRHALINAYHAGQSERYEQENW